MHIQRVRFDRVFSVVRHHTRWGKWTEFGFESGPLKVYQASVYGHPIIPEHVELAVAVPQASDWKNIIGWSNLKTGELVIESELSSGIAAIGILLIAFWLTMAILYLTRVPDLNVGQHFVFLFGLIGASFVAALYLRRSFRIRAAGKALADS
jgi:hypothetical protein